MAVSRQKKEAQLGVLTDLFSTSEGVAFTTFTGATVQEVQNIRRDLRSKNMTYLVAKKTLMALASKQAGKVEFDSDSLPGAVAAIFSTDDVIAPAAAIKKLKKDTFNKETKTSTFDFAGSIFEGEFLDIAQTAQLAETPSREESFAKIISMLRSGPQKIHGVLNSGLRGLANVLDQADKFTK